MAAKTPGQPALAVPSRVRDNARRVAGGDAWLAGLDGHVTRTAAWLALDLGAQVGLDGWCSVLVAGTTARGEDVVLKVGLPDDDAVGEAPTLRAWGGRGAVRLRWASEDGFTLLLDRLSPAENLGDALLSPAAAARHGEGTTLALLAERLGLVLPMLWRSEPDDAALDHLAFVDTSASSAEPAPTTPGAPPPTSALPVLPTTARAARRWAGEATARARAQGFSTATAQLLAGWARELADTEPAPRLLHGDLHANNVVSHGDGWLAIDPKGFVGDPALDLAQAMKDTSRRLQLSAAGARDLGHLLADATGTDPDRVLRWAAVKAMGWDTPGEDVERLAAAASG